MFKLKLSRVRRAINAGSMGMEVLFYEILNQDVQLEIDQPCKPDIPDKYVDWLQKRGAKSVKLKGI